MKRRTPQRVVSISGKYTNDTITQDQLAAVARAQEAEWVATRMVAKAVSDIESRLLHGARVEPGELHFDKQLGMVRSGKKRDAGVRVMS